MKTSRILAFVLALVLLLGLFAGCAVKEPVHDEKPAPEKENIAEPKPEKNPEKVVADPIANTVKAKDYGEVYDLLFENSREFTDDMATGGLAPEMPEGDIPADEPAAEEDSAAGSNDYSGTNVQTEGIDEGDIVKTDGEFIYVLKESSQVVILKADGAGTKEISRIKVADEEIFKDLENGYYSKVEYANQMYLSGDKLIVIKNTGEWSETKNGNSYEHTNEEKASVQIYDVSDPYSPKFLTEAGQNGSVRDSRMDGDTLYLISSYYVWDSDREDERTYIPQVYVGDEPAEILPIDCIVIPEMRNGTAWSVISAVDTANGNIKATHAVMGDASKIYMSRENIYIVSSGYDEEVGEPYTEDQYKVTEYKGESVTTLVKYETVGGKLEYKVTGTVPGYTDSQFSLSEHNGNLRLVTTENWNSYRIYEDEKHGWSNYEHLDSGSHASLFVLDGGLTVIGSVTGLGEDERVYSARFDGDMAYFVTFRETDPLFAVDLSDPAVPKVLSALKIPGFSEYLHFYGEGRLFGLGMAADEETGWTECLKLSMFDTSNPSDVTEKAKLELREYMWSPALYDHHAALINVEKNIIAFPTDSSYLIYGYSDDTGFVKKGEVPFAGWSDNTRGLYIGEYMYICSSYNVTVIDMSDYSVMMEIAI